MDALETQFAAAILPPSKGFDESAHKVVGIDFNDYANMNPTAADLVSGMATMGHQASNLKEATDIINEIRAWPIQAPKGANSAPNVVFLGVTSNLVSSGLRETIRWLVEHRHVSALVMTAGGVEEDLIKCLGPTYLGTASADDAKLREDAVNRIYNLRIPNDNYCKFEEWLTPLLYKFLEVQEAEHQKLFKLREDVLRDMQYNRAGNHAGNLTKAQEALSEAKVFAWTPSRLIEGLGRAIKDESSICYWAAKNEIPIFCPALTDGSLGDIISMFQIRARNRPPFQPVHTPSPSTGNVATGYRTGPSTSKNPANKPYADSPVSPWPYPHTSTGLIIDIAGDIDRINTIARNVALRQAAHDGMHQPRSNNPEVQASASSGPSTTPAPAAASSSTCTAPPSSTTASSSAAANSVADAAARKEASQSEEEHERAELEARRLLEQAGLIDGRSRALRERVSSGRKPYPEHETNSPDFYRNDHNLGQPSRLGAIILGSGLVKHHIMNACLNGGGADAVVYVNTAVENDGSDAGAGVSEAVSWGKVKPEARKIKVWGDATISFPLIVAATWAKKDEGGKKEGGPAPE